MRVIGTIRKDFVTTCHYQMVSNLSIKIRRRNMTVCPCFQLVDGDYDMSKDSSHRKGINGNRVERAPINAVIHLNWWVIKVIDLVANRIVRFMIIGKHISCLRIFFYGFIIFLSAFLPMVQLQDIQNFINGKTSALWQLKVMRQPLARTVLCASIVEVQPLLY